MYDDREVVVKHWSVEFVHWAMNCAILSIVGGKPGSTQFHGLRTSHTRTVLSPEKVMIGHVTVLP